MSLVNKLIVLLVVVSTTLNAQSFSFWKSKVHKPRISDWNLIHEDASSYWVASKDVFLCQFSKKDWSLTKKWEIKIPKKQGKEYQLGVRYLGGKFYLVSVQVGFRKSKDGNTLLCLREINDKFKVSKERKVIDKVKMKENNDPFQKGVELLNFQIYNNPSANQFVVFNGEKNQLTVLNNDLSVSAQKTVNLTKEFYYVQIRDVKFDEKGNMGFLTYDAANNFKFHYLDLATKKLSELKIQAQPIEASDALICFPKGANKFFIAGLTSHGEKVNGTFLKELVFDGTLKVSKEVNTPLAKEVLKNVIPRSYYLETSPKFDKMPDPHTFCVHYLGTTNVGDFKLQSLDYKNGKLYFLAEYVDFVVTEKTMTSTYYRGTSNMRFKVTKIRTFPKFNIYYSDMIAGSLSLDGKLNAGVIYKDQWFKIEPHRGGASLNVIGDDMYVIFNDHRKNIKVNDPNKIKQDLNVGFAKGFLVAAKVSPTGLVTKEVLFDSKQQKLGAKPKFILPGVNDGFYIYTEIRGGATVLSFKKK